MSKEWSKLKRRSWNAGVCIVGGLVMGAVMRGFDILQGENLDYSLTRNTLDILFRGAVFAIVLAFGLWFGVWFKKRRSAKSPKAALDYRLRDAVEKKQLPDDVDTEMSIDILRRWRRANRRAVLPSWGVFAFFLALGLFLTLNPEPTASPLFGGLFLVILVAVTVVAVRSTQKQNRTIEQFITELEQRPRTYA